MKLFADRRIKLAKLDSVQYPPDGYKPLYTSNIIWKFFDLHARYTLLHPLRPGINSDDSLEGSKGVSRCQLPATETLQPVRRYKRLRNTL
jgi:hypothetical protein